jgi:hypothetical protein
MDGRVRPCYLRSLRPGDAYLKANLGQDVNEANVLNIFTKRQSVHKYIE